MSETIINQYVPFDLERDGWDKFTFRASSLAFIMNENDSISNLFKYNKIRESMAKKSEDLMAMKNPDTKTGNKLLDDLEKLQSKSDWYEEEIYSGGPQRKDLPNLSETCKTHLCDIFTAVKYKRKEDVKSKYIEKGLLLEEEAITKYCMVVNEFHIKNKERRRNDYVEGELDFVKPGIKVHDTKVNWSIFQYNRVLGKGFKTLYKWQMKTYMWLWDCPSGRLIYVLLNTPEHLIEKEETRLMFEMFGNKVNYDYASDIEKENYKQACLEIRRNHTYDDIPDREKVRWFDIDREEDDEERIKRRVLECREFLKQLDNGNYTTED